MIIEWKRSPSFVSLSRHLDWGTKNGRWTKLKNESWKERNDRTIEMSEREQRREYSKSRPGEQGWTVKGRYCRKKRGCGPIKVVCIKEQKSMLMDGFVCKESPFECTRIAESFWQQRLYSAHSNRQVKWNFGYDGLSSWQASAMASRIEVNCWDVPARDSCVWCNRHCARWWICSFENSRLTACPVMINELFCCWWGRKMLPSREEPKVSVLKSEEEISEQV